jgi:hypothetical protein
MASTSAQAKPSREEINALLTRVLSLPDLAKFEVFAALREDLAGALNPEHPENQLIQERRDALAYIEKAAKHLGLGVREAPTKAQFDQVAEELGWEWNGAKVNRVWERWRMATDAYLGTRGIKTPAARKRGRHIRGAIANTTQKHLEALRTWLASEPEVETHAAFNKFAEAYNASLPDGAVPFARASTIARGLPVSWQNAIKIARKETTLEQAIKDELAETLPAVLDSKTLVGLPQISRILKASTQVVSEFAANDSKFPVPVAHFDGHAAWLYEDVKLYRRALAVPKRAEDELQRSFMSKSELATRLEKSANAVGKAILRKAWQRVPQPEGELGVGIYYWRREKAEAWIKQAEAAKRG